MPRRGGVLGMSAWVAYGVVSVAYCSSMVYSFLQSTGSLDELIERIEGHADILLALLNVAVVVLLATAKLVISVFFSELRAIEAQRMYQRLVEIMVLKVLIFMELVPRTFVELSTWLAWYGSLAYVRIFVLLCRDRFEYMVATTVGDIVPQIRRVGSFLASLTLLLLALMQLALHVFASANMMVLIVVMADALVALLDAVQTGIKYATLLDDVRHGRDWADREEFLVYVDTVTNVVSRLLLAAHHCVVIYYNGLSVNLLLIVLLFQVRTQLSSAVLEVSRLVHYHSAVHSLDHKLRDATPEELVAFDDDCAICRERMQAAKRLPCGHMFHLGCLKHWLSQHNSCPMCRRSIGTDTSAPATWDAQRGLFGWFVALSRAAFTDAALPVELQFNSAANMQRLIAQVREVLPDAPDDLVRQELLLTRSLVRTVDNLLNAQAGVMAAAAGPPPPVTQPVVVTAPPPRWRFAGARIIAPDEGEVISDDAGSMDDITNAVTITTSNSSSSSGTESDGDGAAGERSSVLHDDDDDDDDDGIFESVTDADVRFRARGAQEEDDEEIVFRGGPSQQSEAASASTLRRRRSRQQEGQLLRQSRQLLDAAFRRFTQNGGQAGGATAQPSSPPSRAFRDVI